MPVSHKFWLLTVYLIIKIFIWLQVLLELGWLFETFPLFLTWMICIREVPIFGWNCIWEQGMGSQMMFRGLESQPENIQSSYAVPAMLSIWTSHTVLQLRTSSHSNPQGYPLVLREWNKCITLTFPHLFIWSSQKSKHHSWAFHF